MEKINKSNYFYKKYKKAQINEFYLFAYFPIIKAEANADSNRQFLMHKLKYLMLPSSFKVIKAQNVQGPRIGIVYGSNLNFEKLKHVYNLKASTLKLKEKWYAYELLSDLKSYKRPVQLCSGVNLVMQKKMLQFFLYLKLVS
jgi:hypothetical protein